MSEQWFCYGPKTGATQGEWPNIVQEGDRPIARCERWEDAEQIVADHRAAEDAARFRTALTEIIEVTDVVEIENAAYQVNRAHRIAREALAARPAQEPEAPGSEALDYAVRALDAADLPELEPTIRRQYWPADSEEVGS